MAKRQSKKVKARGRDAKRAAPKATSKSKAPRARAASRKARSAPAKAMKPPAAARPRDRKRASAKKRTKVCFIGLGLMGAPMASCLLREGFPLQVWNRTREKAEPFAAEGAIVASTPAAAARGADFVVVMVSDDAALDAVLFGEDGLSRGMKRGSMLINCSTTSPGIGYRAATALRSLSVHYLEAPVMRGVQAAREGQLQILAGGSQDAIERARPVLDVLASNVHHVGDIGRAATMKLACNVLAATMMQAFAEYFVLARKSGIPFETMMDVLHAGPLDSQTLRGAEHAVVNPGGLPSFYLRHMLKDVDLTLELAQQLEVPAPMTSATRQILTAANNLGNGDRDFGALLELVAQWAGVAVRG